MAVEGGTARMHEYPLTVLISLLAANRERVRILDFGGGIGSSVPEVLASIPPDSRVEFVIIDNAATCTMGRDLFADEPRVSFVEELPATTEDFDILHCGSSMQYIDDWRGILQRFAEYKAEYMMFSDLLAGDIPTFVTLQVYYDQLIPSRFCNLDEFTDVVKSVGYREIFGCNFLAEIRGTVGPLPMENFPEVNRLVHSCHLIFLKKD